MQYIHRASSVCPSNIKVVDLVDIVIKMIVLVLVVGPLGFLTFRVLCFQIGFSCSFAVSHGHLDPAHWLVIIRHLELGRAYTLLLRAGHLLKIGIVIYDFNLDILVGLSEFDVIVFFKIMG